MGRLLPFRYAGCIASMHNILKEYVVHEMRPFTGRDKRVEGTLDTQRHYGSGARTKVKFRHLRTRFLTRSGINILLAQRTCRAKSTAELPAMKTVGGQKNQSCQVYGISLPIHNHKLDA